MLSLRYIAQLLHGPKHSSQPFPLSLQDPRLYSPGESGSEQVLGRDGPQVKMVSEQNQNAPEPEHPCFVSYTNRTGDPPGKSDM